MTSYERVINSLKKKLTDRVPVVPEVFGVTAKLCDYSLYDYVTDASKLAESQLRAREVIGHDMVFAFADLAVESEAIGCEMIYKEDTYPAVKQPLIKNTGDLETLALPNPLKDGRMPVVIEASSRLRDAVGDTCIVAACVMGPLSIAGQIMGIENLLYQLVDTPDAVEKVLDFTEEVTRRYGKALLQAGAHCHILFDPVASPMVVPQEIFLRLELPRLKKLFKEFKQEGSLICWLSIAGNTRKILPYYRDADVELATVDYTVSLSDACKLVGDLAVNGNLMPFSFVSHSPEKIKDTAKMCIRETANKRDYLLGSGCEIPVEASIEGIKALVEASHELSYSGNTTDERKKN
ncbi:MAG: uroporphyrinogen decarboxylase [Nitrospirae bacterium]|nr:uroporphyrinogen decarboxylase [Nitrospirota bacterium]